MGLDKGLSLHQENVVSTILRNFHLMQRAENNLGQAQDLIRRKAECQRKLISSSESLLCQHQGLNLEDQDALKMQDEVHLLMQPQILDFQMPYNALDLQKYIEMICYVLLRKRVVLFLDKIAEDFASRIIEVIHISVYSNFPLDHWTDINWIMSQHNFAG